jgi:hypothetical protein
MQLSSARNFSESLYYQLHEAVKLSQTISDDAQRDLVTQMILAVEEWFEIAEEIQFITKIELALDDTAQNAVKPIIRARLAKLFTDANNRVDKLTTQIQAQQDCRLLPQANTLLDEGRALVDTLAHEFGPFL